MTKPAIVAGVMSGTSADGIDVALTRIGLSDGALRFRLLAHRGFPYPPQVRKQILQLMNASSARVADLAQLNFLLGEIYADAVTRTMRVGRIARIDLVGCHGQTLYHQGEGANFLGRRLTATWQTGEAAIIAARLGVPVISDFRPADMAVGGKGAPLVPFFDYAFFRHPRRGRILQNIGGIANLTAIPAQARPSEVIAFDTGPGNMVIDACCQRLFHRPMDRNGQIARRGRVLQDVIDKFAREVFFRRPPPRTAGREQFGEQFLARFIRECRRTRNAKREDIVATATAFTSATIVESLRKFVLNRGSNPYQDFIVSGGGARNPTLLRHLRDSLQPLGLTVQTSDILGMPTAAKEAAAFALLAYQTWHHRAGNLPAATGARQSAVLGKISFPPLKMTRR
jgi:anhydro-N-acetylmuramic acid kinase